MQNEMFYEESKVSKNVEYYLSKKCGGEIHIQTHIHIYYIHTLDSVFLNGKITNNHSLNVNLM